MSFARSVISDMSRAMLGCHQHRLRPVGYDTAHRWWKVTTVHTDGTVLSLIICPQKLLAKNKQNKQPYFIQTCLTVKYCIFTRQSRSWSSRHVAVHCVADRIAPKRSTVYTVTDTFTEMQTYCGVKCVVQDCSMLIQHSL